MSKSIPFILLVILWVCPVHLVQACESCLITRLGKDNPVRTESQDQKWFFEYFFEQKNYDRMDLGEAHSLHHAGHEVHDKTTEDFHHFIFGANFSDGLSVTVETPYIIRRSLEVDSHATLGKKQSSEGFGDTTLLSTHPLWKFGRQCVGAAAGIKFPTGYRGEKNTAGTKFEPELQPGSGSFDYIVGGFYKANTDRWEVAGNVSYVINTEGAYDFKFGNALTASVASTYLLSSANRKVQVRVGGDVVYQNSWKEKHNGLKNPDSGGQRILGGPLVTMRGGQTTLLASILFPAYQNMGGLHQELDYTWTLAARIAW